MFRPMSAPKRRLLATSKWVVRTLCGVLFSAFFVIGDTSVGELLPKNCAECPSGKIRTSGFSVDSLDAVIRGGNKHGRAVNGGHPENSLLVKLLKGEMAPRMPMGRELPAADIARIEDWIRSLPPSADIAPAGEWRWPYQKPVKQDPPAVAN